MHASYKHNISALCAYRQGYLRRTRNLSLWKQNIVYFFIAMSLISVEVPIVCVVQLFVFCFKEYVLLNP